MIGIIAAVSHNGVIGLDNKLPFDYSEDLKHFKKTTLDSIVIMGRKTFEGIGRPLPKRRNIVVSRIVNGLGTLDQKGIEVATSFELAMEMANEMDFVERDTWIIGGSSVYEYGMQYADKIVLTITPDIISGPNAIKFPWINPLKFACVEMLPMEADPRLTVVRYERI